VAHGNFRFQVVDQTIFFKGQFEGFHNGIIHAVRQNYEADSECRQHQRC